MQISGWINLDKPVDMSSTKAVSIIRKLFNTKKVGHAGTLDPLASGVLPIAIGEATKTVSFIQDREKVYEFTLQFGKEMSTHDEEGDVVAENDFMPSLSDIESVLHEFIGEINQVPPVFSAIWINGVRAYHIARAGENVDMKPRKIRIDSLEVKGFDFLSKNVSFEVICGKGTYIRSLGNDIAKKLGGLGYIRNLRRTKVGAFTKKNLISVEKLKELVHNAQLENYLLSLDSVLDDIPAILFSDDDSIKLLRGMGVKVTGSVVDDSASVFIAKGLGKLLAIGKVESYYFRPMRVFNL